MKRAILFSSLSCVALGTGLPWEGILRADDSPQTNATRNKEIVQNGKMTADDQSNKQNDVELTARIRTAVMKNKSLSVDRGVIRAASNVLFESTRMRIFPMSARATSGAAFL